LCVGITIGFLLSAEFAIPAKDTAEIIIADKRDIIFLIFSPFLILSKISICLLGLTVN